MAATITGAAASRDFGPDTVSAPTHAPAASNTGADADAVSGSRSPYDAAHSCSRTSFQRASCVSVKASSTFPAPYVNGWNAFKRLTAHASADERDALFRGTVTRVYRLG